MVEKSRNTRNIKSQTIINLIVLLVIIILVNIISQFVFTRFDLTSDKRYSLGESTKETISELDDIIYLAKHIIIHLSNLQLALPCVHLIAAHGYGDVVRHSSHFTPKNFITY